jgi:hypothetical protein
MNSTRRLFCLFLAVGATALAATAAPALAAFEIESFSGSTDSYGHFSRQAGAHSDLTTSFSFTHKEFAPGTGRFSPDEDPRNVAVELPPGLVGNPSIIPTCTAAELTAGQGGGTPVCPAESQVGIATIDIGQGIPFRQPVFNMERTPEQVGLFALNFSGVIIRFLPEVRSTDYGVNTLVPSISQAMPIVSVGLTLWAVPADPIHDSERYNPETFSEGMGSTAIPRPFMTNPTSCPAQPTVTHGTANSWQHPEDFIHASFDSDPNGIPFIWKECERVPFRPTTTVQSGTHRAANPTGLDFRIAVPQPQDPEGITSANVRKIVTEFPEGVSASPSAVAGLGACSPAEIGLGSAEPPTCPDSSKLGNVTINTPLLEKPLEGEVILASQNDNPFHSTFAVYLVAPGPGFYLKVPGELNIDKKTGELKTVFENLPQQPFSEVHLDFRGGPTAPFTTPNVCGTYKTRTTLTSWASPDPVVTEAPMLIDENCTGGGSFNPQLQAGVANPVAGAKSPLTIRIRRADGEQNLSHFDITLPQGELANLSGLAVCSDAGAATGNCPAGSQVGISTTAIGTGAFPLFVPQPGKDPTALYLAGPYKGSPYSLVAKVPAQSGPFDFGNIVVRTAINLNPVTAQVIAESDPLPQILEGVPIQYRDVRIEVQKPDFSVNPTSCEQRHVTTSIYSIEGAVSHPSVPTKVGDCGALNFRPKLAFKLKGGTNRGDFQALTATLTTGKKEANISRVAVTLPHSEFLEQAHIGTVCTKVQFAQKACPDASIYGYAEAVTPLLDQPLKGPVYLRSSTHRLPDLVAALRGQFNLELAGRIDSVNERIRTSFETVPDAPVTKFVLRMRGGKKSLLVNSRNLCKATGKAEVKMVGQNGKHHNEAPVVKNSCTKADLRKAKRAAKKQGKAKASAERLR